MNEPSPMLPKAEIHCHIEGAAHPELVQEKARKYGVDVSGIIGANGEYIWHDFTSFIHAYDVASSVFKSGEDYEDLTLDILMRLSAQGCIYSEQFLSTDHAQSIGLDPDDMMEGILKGVARAKAETGIEARLILTGVRHQGPQAVMEAARYAASFKHPLVTGFGMGGDERVGEERDFAKAFELAGASGLGLTGHAGELTGAQTVERALDCWHITRIGHGVRSIEDPKLVQRIADEGIVLECCPGSNIALKVFDGFANHSFPALREAGCKVTLNSDDPPFFSTNLEREYAIAKEHFGCSDADLLEFTITAIEAGFMDEDTRAKLLEKCRTNRVG